MPETAGTHAPRIVIVGAGPAGVRAAERLVAAGLRPSVIDEGQAAGGQIYKQPAPHHAADGATLYGSEAGKAAALHARFAALRGRIDYRAKTLVWDAVPGRLHLQDLAAGGTGALDWSHLILATGAMDRVMPLPGWTLPGVFTLGGAQSLLKTQGCLIGRRTGFVGTGPLLYWVAVQYARAGADIAAVLDTTGFGRQLAKGVGLLGAPDFLRRGLAFVSELKRRGVPVYRGITAPEVLGEREVAGLSFRHGGQRLELACDAVALGHGLRSEIALADLLDLPFAYRRDQQQWTPRRDAAGRTPMPGVYLAGDGAGIGGADAAELEGRLAAEALLADLGRAPGAGDGDGVGAGAGAGAGAGGSDRRRLRRLRRVRRTLDAMYPLPVEQVAAAPDELVICRCEGVTAGQIRAAVAHPGAEEVNRAKAFSRVGMGRCQGRVCGLNAQIVTAAARGCTLEAAGRLRGQAPVKPVPVEDLASALPEPRDD